MAFVRNPIRERILAVCRRSSIGFTNNELAKRLNVKPGSIAAITGRMFNDGLLTRSQDLDDRDRVGYREAWIYKATKNNKESQ